MSERAWVTLATNDSYALGALVLARSLRRVNASGKLVVMVTPGVTASMRETLSSEFDEVTGVNILDSEDSANLALLSRPELGITFTKLHCWRLTQFSKCVFLDADTLVLQNCDELFDRDEFSAAPDVGWPDCFNSGVFVYKPSIDTYNSLLAFAVSTGSFDGGDQGLLNLYFHDWSVSNISRHLPFIYNMVASATYSYLPAFKVFGANVKIVHFIGSEKPWLMYFDSATRTVRAPSGQEHLQELLQSWWDIFRADVHRKLSPNMGGDDNLSATLVEQVQDTFSHIYISDSSSAFSNTPFSSNYEYQPPPIPTFEPPPPPSSFQSSDPIPQPPVSEFHWVSVAIQRQPPENLYQPPPPPPEPSESQAQPISSPQNLSDLHQSPQMSSEGEGHFVHKEKTDCEPDGSKPELDSNKSESETSSAGLAGAFAKMSLEGEKSADQIGFEEQMRKHAWEQGHIDYMGKDSFENIMKKIQTSIAKTSAEPEKPKSPSPPKTIEVPPQTAAPEQPAQEPAPAQAPSASAPQPSPAAPEAPQAVPETPVAAPSVPVADKPSQEAEEARLAAERQALEKKLAEQKRIAEQRLQEEKQAAEARAAAEAAGAAQAKPDKEAPPPIVPTPVEAAAPAPEAPSAVAPAAPAPVSETLAVAGPADPSVETPAAATAPTVATAAEVPPSVTAPPAPAVEAPTSGAEASAPPAEASGEAPVAPPRRQSKVQEATGGAVALWRNVGVRVGVGLSCIAVVAFAIYGASASRNSGE